MFLTNGRFDFIASDEGVLCFETSSADQILFSEIKMRNDVRLQISCFHTNVAIK